MVRVRYTGISEFELKELAPAITRLRALQLKCKPLGENYMALSNMIAAYQALATRVTGRRYFYDGDPDAADGPQNNAPGRRPPLLGHTS